MQLLIVPASLAKSHPIQQAMSADRKPADLVDGKARRNPGEPSPEQAKSDDYKKPRVTWRGLTIAIENLAGSVRRGKGWEVRMKFDYGEIVGSMGVDGDPVDIYLGPNLDDAPMVYVVHQRKNKDWDKYDEDKVMAGFLTEEDARQAFLSNYTDQRFLGPITAMPVDEFITKVRATKEKPTMIKAILFFKSTVGPYLRRGKLVNLAGYQAKQARPKHDPYTMDMFPDDATDSAHAVGDKWQMPIKEAIKEHKELIHAAETPGKADDKREVEKQKEELGRMEGADKKKSIAPSPVYAYRILPVKNNKYRVIISPNVGKSFSDQERGALVMWLKGLGFDARIDYETRKIIVSLHDKEDIDKIPPSLESEERGHKDREKYLAEEKAEAEKTATKEAETKRLKQTDAYSFVERLLGNENFQANKLFLTRYLLGETKEYDGVMNWQFRNKLEESGINSENNETVQDVAKRVKSLYEKSSKKADANRAPAIAYNAAVTSTKTGPDDDNPRRKYYVTIAREGRGVSKLAGPFDTHDEAKAHVDRAREEAVKIDPRAHFDAFGTAGVEADEHKPGVLNERLGIKRR